MPAPLNIRDIGQARKQAVEREAKLQGSSIAEIVREWIDLGIAQAEAAREKEAWIAAAEQGIADEARDLEANGPTLARFRRV